MPCLACQNAMGRIPTKQIGPITWGIPASLVRFLAPRSLTSTSNVAQCVGQAFNRNRLPRFPTNLVIGPEFPSEPSQDSRIDRLVLHFKCAPCCPKQATSALSAHPFSIQLLPLPKRILLFEGRQKQNMLCTVAGVAPCQPVIKGLVIKTEAVLIQNADECARVSKLRHDELIHQRAFCPAAK